MHARDAMTREVVWVDPKVSLHDAAEIMKEWEIRHLPIMAAGRLVGILSDRDVLLHTRLTDDGGSVVAPVSVAQVMTPEPISCSPDSSIAHVAFTMVGKKIDSLPVVDEDGGLLGLITSSDLLGLLAAEQRAAAPLGAPQPSSQRFSLA